MKKALPLLIGLCLTASAYADNLLSVYEQAKLTNPSLRSSQADRDKAYSAISGSRASLLPQLGINASYGLAQGFRDADDQNKKSGNLSLTLTQSLFDYSYWKTLDITKKSASIADISYQYAGQTLILNTSVAYFNVLNAIDTISYIDAEKAYIYKQLEQTKQKYNVGLVAITDVQNAQAQYDQVVADQVVAHNDLNNAVEALRQVSGRFYPSLASINTNTFKTTKPDPVNQLLQLSENTNLELLTSRLNQEVAKEQIRLAQAGHLPTLSLEASSGVAKNQTYGEYYYSSGQQSKSYNGSHSVSVNLNIPLYSGGGTQSQVEQAQHNYVSYSEQLEGTHRSTIYGVRSNFNNISAAISSINAYQQAVVSAQSSLDATQSGYEVGTRTIVDVLSSVSTLYNAKKSLSNSKYTYLTSLLQLKYAIGTLTIDDLLYLNSMLGKEVSTVPTLD